MAQLLRLAYAIDAFNMRIGKTAAWFGLFSVIVCAVTALARYSLNIGSNAWLELQWYFNAVMFMLVAAWTLKRNEHVRIDVIAGKLSPRAQAWIDIFGAVFFLLPVVVVIGWYSLPSLFNSYDITEYSSDPGGLLRWPVRLIIPITFAQLLLQGFSEVVKRAAFLRGIAPDPAQQKHEVVES